MAQALATETREAIQKLIARYPEKAAALIPALYVVQKQLGYVPESSIEELAELTGVGTAQVKEVFTFYTMFHREPQGGHRVEVCTNFCCQIRGGKELLDHVCEKLGVNRGGTTDDGKITVAEVECLGSCGTAPMLRLDDSFHESLSIERVDELLDGID